MEKTETVRGEAQPWMMLRAVIFPCEESGKPANGYRAYVVGWKKVGIAKYVRSAARVVLAEFDLGLELNQPIEWTMAAVDDEIRAYIDGKLVVSARDSEINEPAHAMFSTAEVARMSTAEIMVLDHPKN